MSCLRELYSASPPAEHVDPADAAARHRIVRLSEVRSRTLVRHVSGDWIAVLKSIQGAARLHGRPQVCRGQRERRQAERVRGVGLLGGESRGCQAIGCRDCCQ